MIAPAAHLVAMDAAARIAAERASDILLAYVNRKVEDHAKALGV